MCIFTCVCVCNISCLPFFREPFPALLQVTVQVKRSRHSPFFFIVRTTKDNLNSLGRRYIVEGIDKYRGTPPPILGTRVFTVVPNATQPDAFDSAYCRRCLRPKSN